MVRISDMEIIAPIIPNSGFECLDVPSVICTGETNFLVEFCDNTSVKPFNLEPFGLLGS